MLPEKGILTKQGTYIMVILGMGKLNDYPMHMMDRINVVKHTNTQTSIASNRIFCCFGSAFLECSRLRSEGYSPTPQSPSKVKHE